MAFFVPSCRDPRRPRSEVHIGAGKGEGLAGADAGIGEERQQGIVAGLIDVAAFAYRGHQPLELGVGQEPLARHAAKH